MNDVRNEGSGIYRILNLSTGEFYIGSTVNFYKRRYGHFRELKQNKHLNYHLQNSFNKHGIDNFQFEILELIEDKTKLIQREQYYLDFLKPHYNICKKADNCFGRVVTQKTREKKRNLVTEERKREISKHWLNYLEKHGCINKGKKHTLEHREKNSKAKKQYYSTHLHYNIGKRLSEATKDKLRTPIIQLDKVTGAFIREWKAIQDVRDFFKSSSVFSCLAKKTKTANGFCWVYKKDYESLVF